jgi:hypothetical protein
MFDPLGYASTNTAPAVSSEPSMQADFTREIQNPGEGRIGDGRFLAGDRPQSPGSGSKRDGHMADPSLK